MPEPMENNGSEKMPDPFVQAGQVATEMPQAPAQNASGMPSQNQYGADEGFEDDFISEEELDALRAVETAFSWQASEYVHHHKGPIWYLSLFGVLAVLIVIAVFLKLWLTIILFMAMGAAIVVYARKPPRLLTYELTPDGITIEHKKYSFSDFRSFGVLPDAEWHTIDLEPTKRFSPRITLLFNDEDFDEIVGHLELHLPREDRKPDVIEWLTRYLRF